MMVSLVLAVSENGVIGKDNDLPWRLPADLRFFKELTTGHSILMGRKTFDSIGRALPRRRNIVVSRNRDLALEGAEVFHGLGEALRACVGEEEVFVIGGATIYRQALELDVADRIYLTVVHGVFEGDTFFAVPEGPHWRVVSDVRHVADARNAWDYSFRVLERVS